MPRLSKSTQRALDWVNQLMAMPNTRLTVYSPRTFSGEWVRPGEPLPDSVDGRLKLILARNRLIRPCGPSISGPTAPAFQAAKDAVRRKFSEKQKGD